MGVGAVAVVLTLIVAFVVVANGASETGVVPPIVSAEPDPTPAATEAPGPREDTAPVEPPGPLVPDGIEASSELSPDFAPGLMLDGDLTTAWNDASLHGDGATLTFRFATPATFDRLIITNLSDPDRFIRNYRLRGYAISIDGAPPAIVGELQDTPAPQTIELGGAQGSVVTLSVASTFASEATDSGPGFEELAIAEVEFIGRVSGES
ncbi:MAG: discoidin domain-containing protein [Acidimicrobiia bacterium]|nr:discoidin domain-containing protein [Acidimicrobiia bacterium]